jgi:hypothetical protein
MNLKPFFVVGAALAALPHAARAASFTQTFLLTFNDVPVWTQTAHGSGYSISGETAYGMGWNFGTQFDSALGQLDSLEWAVTMHAELPTAYAYLQPPAPVGPGSVTESWTMQFLRLGSFSVLGKYFVTGTGPFATTGSLSVPVGGAASHTLSLDGTVTGSVTDPALLNDFIQGTSLYLDTVSRHLFNTQYADGGPGLPDLQVELGLTYHYTPAVTPEPGAVGLSALGGLALLTARRRAAASR